MRDVWRDCPHEEDIENLDRWFCFRAIVGVEAAHVYHS